MHEFTDSIRKAVQQLANKEMLLFATAVSSLISRGEPSNASLKTPPFAEKGDKHIKAFQPYLDMTCTGHELVAAGCTSIAAELCFITDMPDVYVMEISSTCTV